MVHVKFTRACAHVYICVSRQPNFSMLCNAASYYIITLTYRMYHYSTFTHFMHVMFNS